MEDEEETGEEEQEEREEEEVKIVRHVDSFTLTSHIAQKVS